MSDFFSKISQSKAKVLLGLGGAALIVGLGYLYKNYSNESEEEVQNRQVHDQPHYDLDAQINKLKSQINLANPSLEDVKKILVFSLDASKKNQNLDQYLRMVAQGMTQIQQIGMTLQQEIMMKIGVTQQVFAKYQHQLGPFLQQQMMNQGIGSQSNKELTLDQVKKAINLQIEYMANHGDEMVDRLINACSGWGPQEKSLVPTLISVYIADQVFEDHPEIDEDDLQGAQMKFQYSLQNEMAKLQKVMSPMMAKLTQGLGFSGMGGMGGMGGMDMGYGGPTMEQLEQLRLQDPAAFEQLMYMMNAGMQ